MAMLIDVAGDFIWNLLRFGAFLMVVPIFGNQLIPGRVRLLLAVGVSFALTPVAGGAPPMEQWGLDSMGMLVTQMAMGVGLGFAAVIFFHLFVIAGQFIGMQMGLGFAAMVDPGNGIQVTVWSQFFLMLVTLSFLSLNGHLVLLEVLTHGYRLYPQIINNPNKRLNGKPREKTFNAGALRFITPKARLTMSKEITAGKANKTPPINIHPPSVPTRHNNSDTEKVLIWGYKR